MRLLTLQDAQNAIKVNKHYLLAWIDEGKIDVLEGNTDKTGHPLIIQSSLEAFVYRRLLEKIRRKPGRQIVQEQAFLEELTWIEALKQAKTKSLNTPMLKSSRKKLTLREILVLVGSLGGIMAYLLQIAG